MTLGRNTEAFFQSLQTNEPTKSISDFSITEARNTFIPGFADLATPFPDSVTEKDFIRHTITLPSGNPIAFDSFIPKKVADKPLLPTVIYFYGGGFCLNLFAAQRAPMATLANETNCQVININYPLAPEHSINEIIDICYAVISYLYQHHQLYKIDKEAFMLSGCSSGGMIAALLTNRSLTDPALKVRLQILFTPLVDCSLSLHYNNEFVNYQQQDLLQTDEALEFYLNSLNLNTITAKSPDVSPYYNNNLKGLPKTAIIVGEYDSLRGDGEMYAKKLKQQNVDVELIIGAGQIHAFLVCRKVLNDAPDPAILAASFVKKNLTKD